MERRGEGELFARRRGSGGTGVTMKPGRGLAVSAAKSLSPGSSSVARTAARPSAIRRKPVALGRSSRSPSVPSALDTVIAVPVRNEAERIVACLRAIDAQTGLAPGRLGLVLFPQQLQRRHAGHRRRPSASPHAPGAGDRADLCGRPCRLGPPGRDGRRRRLARRGGSVGHAPDHRRRQPRAAGLGRRQSRRPGCGRRCGRRPGRADPGRGGAAAALAARPRRLEDAYDALITEMEARIDPDPSDPWPCHRTTIGAPPSPSAARPMGRSAACRRFPWARTAPSSPRSWSRAFASATTGP